jgi:dTDP-4-dehydrorhamnose reductase
MSRVLLVGASGQLGSDLLKLAGDRDLVAGAGLDIRDRDAVRDLVARARPDVIVNAAAYVDVEACETNRELAFAVNADGVRNLAETGVPIVQMSTDYVFDGAARQPYLEDAIPNPLNVYGASKLAGEEFGRLVVRSSGLYGVAATRAKGNFVRTMLRLGRERDEVSVVTDQVLTPTNTEDLARLLWEMVDRGAQGLYHATNAGQCSWFEFAQAIFELSGLHVTVRPIDSATLGYKARRPAYSVLDNSKLARDGFTPLRPWREALAGHLTALAPLT